VFLKQGVVLLVLYVLRMVLFVLVTTNRGTLFFADGVIPAAGGHFNETGGHN
jgi:hypothetical protein